MVTQLQHNIERNLSWLEGNVTYQRQIELETMNESYQIIVQQQQALLIQV